MQIPGQAAAALGAADDFDETGPFELFRNLIANCRGTICSSLISRIFFNCKSARDRKMRMA